MSEEKKEPGQKSAEQVARDYASVQKHQTGPRLPKIDFSMFIFSLNSSVLVNLGILEEPGTGRKEKNLPVAKQTIDILAMLEEKTRGNLEKEESDMLKHILYDLRLLYVKEIQ